MTPDPMRPDANPKSTRTDTMFHDVARFRALMFDRLFAPHGLTMSQAWVLLHLFREDGQTQTSLANKMEVGVVTLGGLVDRLEARDLVRRQADLKDRRAKRVFVTDAAKPLGRMMNRFCDIVDDECYAGISPEEREQHLRVLDKVRCNIRRALETERREGAVAKSA